MATTRAAESRSVSWARAEGAFPGAPSSPTVKGKAVEYVGTDPDTQGDVW